MYRKQLDQIFADKGGKRRNGRTASVRTQELTRQVVDSSFRQLNKLGFHIENPANLNNKHLTALVRHWWHNGSKNSKTIQSDLSRLRQFCIWIGKGGMIKPLKTYLPEVDHKELIVHTAASKPKSWAGNGINAREIIHKAHMIDTRLALMLIMQLVFGLRREETLKVNTHTQDHGHAFIVFDGMVKGGKPRAILMDENQRKALDYIKQHIGKNETLGWPYQSNGQRATLKQNLARYSALMRRAGITKKKIGVSGHGLRAQFIENRALVNELLPPSLGGKKDQMPRDERKIIETQLSESIGHHRSHILPAYYGSFDRENGGEVDERKKRNIHKAKEQLPQDLPIVPEPHLPDCIHIISELAYHQVTPPTEFDPEQHARIRVFHGLFRGLNTRIYIGDVCERPGMPSFAAAYSGWSSMVSNKTIGIPITEDMHTSSYHEYIIPAGGKISVEMQRTHIYRLTFTPEAGSDYETYFISKLKAMMNWL